MRVPMTSRKYADKPFYVFFKFMGRYHGRYAIVHASSYEKAQYKAYELYGHEVARVVAKEDEAKAQIQTYYLTKF